MNNNKQTAVEWLFEKINMFCLFTDGIPDEWSEALEQAKEMEKKQIEDAWYAGDEDGAIHEFEYYYNETYRK